MWSKVTSLFRKKSEPANFGLLGADMHSHLIAGIDDGVNSIEEALVVLREMHAMGYRKAVTTPHIMADYYRNDPPIILRGLEILKAAAEKEGIDMELDAAAEYYLDDGFLKLLDSGELLTFGDNYLLFELSFMNKAVNLETAVFKMRTQSYQPVLAHPERYTYFHQGASLDDYSRMRELGLLFQINLGSFAGAYGEEVKKIARKLSTSGMVDFLGTDLHGPQYLSAIEKARNDKYVMELLESGNLKNQELL